MAGRIADQMEIVKAAKRIEGWTVRPNKNGYSIHTNSTSEPVIVIHLTPSDSQGWRIMRSRLKRAGMTEAMLRQAETASELKAEKLAEERAAADRSAEQIALKARNEAALNRAGSVMARISADGFVDPETLLTATSVDTTVKTIMTPAVAEKLLALNTRNRPVKKAFVADLVDDIINGRWRLTHQAAAIDWDGNLADGQHRLLACIASGHEISMRFTLGVDPADFPVYDTGKARSAADVINVVTHGEVRGPLPAAIARLVYWFDLLGTPAEYDFRRKFSPAIATTAFERVADLLPNASLFANRLSHHRPVVPKAAYGAAWLVLVRAHGGFDERGNARDQRIVDFFDVASTGRCDSDKDPRRAVWRLLIDPSSSVRRSSTAPQLAVLLKAWRDYATGKRNVSYYRFLDTEQFPAVFVAPPLD